MATATKKADKKVVARVTETAARQEAIKNALTMIEKDFGKGAIMKLGEKKVDHVPVIPTGILSLDRDVFSSFVKWCSDSTDTAASNAFSSNGTSKYDPRINVRDLPGNLSRSASSMPGARSMPVIWAEGTVSK